MAEVDTLQAAIFRVGSERFALNIKHIREITRLEEITRVPSMPDFVEGVMELRGQIIPIVDLRKRLDAAIENTRQTRIIVSRIDRKPLGLVVDEVTDVWEVEPDEINDSPSVGTAFQPSFLHGVLKRDDHIVFFLKFSELLTTTEKARMEDLASKKKAAARKAAAKKPRKTTKKKDAS